MAGASEQNFSVASPCDRDLWRKPPTTDVDTAPSQTIATLPLTGLKSVTATFRADYRHLYDQGGILFKFSNPSHRRSKWIKAGVEVLDGKRHVSVVGCDGFADWSLHPMAGSVGGDGNGADGSPVTLLAVKEANALWIYQVVGREQKVRLREVTWVADDQANTEVSVGAFAARPAKEEVAAAAAGGASLELEVHFDDFTVETV